MIVKCVKISMLCGVSMLKWSLNQLYRFSGKSFEFDGVLNYDERVKNIEDILSISSVKVKGIGKQLYEDRYTFNIHIECTLYLECARTLEEVSYPINLDVEEVFDTQEYDTDEDINIIPKNTIDLRDVIFQDIYLEKPIRVVKEGSTPIIDDYITDEISE